MTLHLEIEFPTQFAAQLEADIERERHELSANVALETERVLRVRASDWPQDTGFSRDRFRAEDDSATGDVLILNSARYAAAVNNRSNYPRGGANPNYLAAQRSVEKAWNRILRRALRND